MSRATAIKAAADRLRDQTDPTIWRSFEALAEAVLDAAEPHLNLEQPATADLFTA